MRRREFIAGLGGTGVSTVWLLAVRAQQPALPVIGILSGGSAETSGENIAAFQRGLSELGYVEGRNVAVEYGWAYGQNGRLPALIGYLPYLLQQRPWVKTAKRGHSAAKNRRSTIGVPSKYRNKDGTHMDGDVVRSHQPPFSVCR
jgi:hypothetical protein